MWCSEKQELHKALKTWAACCVSAPSSELCCSESKIHFEQEIVSFDILSNNFVFEIVEVQGPRSSIRLSSKWQKAQSPIIKNVLFWYYIVKL